MNKIIKYTKQIFKQSLDLIKYMFKYKEIIVSRSIRSFYEKHTPILKVIKPMNFDEAIFVLNEISNNTYCLKIYTDPSNKAIIIFNHNNKKNNFTIKDLIYEYKTSKEFSTAVNNSFGQLIRNEFLLWAPNSSLYKDMKSRFNLFYADDMSSVILQTLFQRQMNLVETPTINALSYILYWQDMKKQGNWDGIANGEKINIDFPLPLNLRKEIEKEKIKYCSL